MSENADILSNVSKYDYGTYKHNSEKNKKHNFISHHVLPDETLTSIAIKYNVSVNSLLYLHINITKPCNKTAMISTKC